MEAAGTYDDKGIGWGLKKRDWLSICINSNYIPGNLSHMIPPGSDTSAILQEMRRLLWKYFELEKL